MTDDTKTGGPAFPCDITYQDGSGITSDGITVRDYFAAKAMQSALTHRCSGDVDEWIKENARLSYIAADAMIAAREQQSWQKQSRWRELLCVTAMKGCGAGLD